MPNEINISATTGLSISLQLYSGAVAIGSPFAATEIGTTGEYVASVPNGTAFGRYLVIATAGDFKIASGQLLWDGAYEFIQGLVTIQGLDPNNPSTTTPTNWDAGDVHINISGDGVTQTEMQRV
jgi:hypothetical protein